MANSAKVIWKGTPSHYDYFVRYVIVVILAIPTFGISLLYGAYLYYDIKNTKYTLTEEALLLRSGIFTRVTDELMLYRIQDISMEEPFMLRMVNLSNLKIYSSDPSNPVFDLTSLENGEKLRLAIRKLSEKQRQKLGVRAIDIVRD